MPWQSDVTAVVRYQGGDNAGHTIMLGEEVFKLHLVPSGVLYPHIAPIIGNGVVVNPATLIAELDMLAGRGIEVDRVRVSKHAHVIMPYHIALDGAMEADWPRPPWAPRGAASGRPTPTAPGASASEWKTCSTDPALRSKLARILPEKNATLQRQHRVEGFDLDELVALATEWGSAQAASGRHDSTRPGDAGSRRAHPVRRARRERCSIWTTAAIRS
jgi:adenylosuccinate synthase